MNAINGRVPDRLRWCVFLVSCGLVATVVAPNAPAATSAGDSISASARTLARLGRLRPAWADSLDEIHAQFDLGRFRLAHERLDAEWHRLEQHDPIDTLGVALTIDALLEAEDLDGESASDAAIRRARLAVKLKESLLGLDDEEVATSLYRLGVLLADHGDTAEAGRTLWRALSIREARLGPDDLQVGQTLVALALVQRQNGGWKEGRALYGRAFEIWDRAMVHGVPFVAQAVRGAANYLWGESWSNSEIRRLNDQMANLSANLQLPRNAAVLQSWTAAATVMQGQGTWDGAWPLIQAGIDAFEERVGPPSVHLALGYQGLGMILSLVGDRGELGRKFLEHSQAIWGKTVGTAHPDYARILWLRGASLSQIGRYAEAKPLFEQSYAILRARHGEDHPATMRSALSLLDLAAAQGPPADLRERYLRLLSRAEAVPAAHALREPIELSLAQLAFNLGEMTEAEDRTSHAVALDEAEFGPQDYAVAGCLRQRGEARAARGDLSGAYEDLLTALHIYQAVDADTSYRLAGCQNGLGILLTAMGRPQEAMRFFRPSIDYVRSTRGVRGRDLSVALANLADCENSLGRYALARDTLIASEAMWDSLGLPTGIERALADNSLACAELGMGHAGAALERSDRAIDAARALLPEGSPRWSQLRLQRASALLALGRYDVARSDLEAARGVLGPSPDEASQAMLEYGLLKARLYWRTGDVDSCLRVASQSEPRRRERMRLGAQSMPERDARALDARTPSFLPFMIAAALRAGSDSSCAVAYDELIRSRGLLLEEAARRVQEIASTPSGSIALRRQAVASARQRYTNLLFAGPGSRSLDRNATLLERAKSDLAAADRLLARSGGQSLAQTEPPSAGLDKVRSAVGRHEALVSYVRYSDLATDRPERDAYAAFVLSPARAEPRLIPLGSAAGIDSCTQRLAEESISPMHAPGFGAREPDQRYRLAAIQVRRRLWDPIATELGDADKVWIVPDALLRAVHWPALVADDGSYFVERGPEISELDAERDLVRLTPGSVANRGLLAVGGVDFEAADTSRATESDLAATYRASPPRCEEARKIRFPRLPGSAQEVAAVERVWHESLPDEPAEVLTSGIAQESRFKREAHGKRVLHLATHTYFLGEDCGANSDSASSGRLALAGLAFAGANRRAAARPGTEDGILTAEEVSSLDLRGTELVVLSGCETGRGESAQVEGLSGLHAAFRVAGAHSLIESSWPVEDQAARSWMIEFYRARFERGLTSSRAARLASVRLLQERRRLGLSSHPFYWSLFANIGE